MNTPGMLDQLRVYARHPDHPGAMHYLVHANDVPGREHESLETTHTYAAAARKAGETLFARNIQVLGLDLNAWTARLARLR